MQAGDIPTGGQRNQENHPQHAEGQIAAARQQEGQQRREEKVELLFNRQAPGVHQRLEVHSGAEIAVLAPEQEIGGKQRRRDQALAAGCQLVGQQQGTGKGQGHQHHEQQGRDDYPDASLVELQDGEAARLDVLDQNRSDQEVGITKRMSTPT